MQSLQTALHLGSQEHGALQRAPVFHVQRHTCPSRLFLRNLFSAVLLASLAAPSIAGSWRVLVLGGTGFKGHFTTERLIHEGHNVTVLSRGESYWGIFESLKGRATHWRCNRTIAVGFGGATFPESSGLVNCSQLVNSTVYFDAVVDFSSRSLEELRQALRFLKGRVGVWVYISSHAVYEVSKNSTHGDPLLHESDAARPGREISPLERFQLKAQSSRGDAALECEEELMKQYNSGGFPFVTLRLANVIGQKENTIRYWLMHLWVRANLALTMPMQLDQTLLQTPISMTYTPDVAQAVVRVIARSRGETCCPEHVNGEAFNIACEEAPTQKVLYEKVAEPIGVPYIETQEVHPNKSVVLYPDIKRGPLSISKALDVLRFSPTDLGKAVRSVARFYDRVMLDERKYKPERNRMYGKCKRMLGDDGPRFVSWIRAYYDERRKTELYDELDDEDEDDLLLVRPDPEQRPTGRKRKRRKHTSKRKDGDL